MPLASICFNFLAERRRHPKDGCRAFRVGLVRGDVRRRISSTGQATHVRGAHRFKGSGDQLRSLRTGPGSPRPARLQSLALQTQPGRLRLHDAVRSGAIPLWQCLHCKRQIYRLTQSVIDCNIGVANIFDRATDCCHQKYIFFIMYRL